MRELFKFNLLFVYKQASEHTVDISLERIWHTFYNEILVSYGILTQIVKFAPETST